jgi:Lon protease-like protein
VCTFDRPRAGVMSMLRVRDMVWRMQPEASVRKVIPLFPLGTVLFSGGRLPLRIFEPRYTAMVSRCLREKSGFGVVLIREGSDARLGKNPTQPDIFSVGTYGTIVDFNTLNNGMLGIITSGGSKFRILETSETNDHLLMGTVEFLPEERAQATGEEHASLIEMLRELMKHPMAQKLALDVDYRDARSVSWRLSELLPLEPEIKQGLLQMSLPRERLAELTRIVNNLRN